MTGWKKHTTTRFRLSALPSSGREIQVESVRALGMRYGATDLTIIIIINVSRP